MGAPRLDFGRTPVAVAPRALVGGWQGGRLADVAHQVNLPAISCWPHDGDGSFCQMRGNSEAHRWSQILPLRSNRRQDYEMAKSASSRQANVAPTPACKLTPAAVHFRRAPPLPVVTSLMPKSSNEPGLEVADFIVSAAGSQVQRRLRGQNGHAADFADVFCRLPVLGCRYREISHVAVDEGGLVSVTGVALVS